MLGSRSLQGARTRWGPELGWRYRGCPVGPQGRTSSGQMRVRPERAGNAPQTDPTAQASTRRPPEQEWDRYFTGLPRRLGGKESACQHRRYKRCGFDVWLRKIPWRRKWQPTPVFLPGKSHGQRSLVDCSSWGSLFHKLKLFWMFQPHKLHLSVNLDRIFFTKIV